MYFGFHVTNKWPSQIRHHSFPCSFLSSQPRSWPTAVTWQMKERPIRLNEPYERTVVWTIRMNIRVAVTWQMNEDLRTWVSRELIISASFPADWAYEAPASRSSHIKDSFILNESFTNNTSSPLKLPVQVPESGGFCGNCVFYTAKTDLQFVFTTEGLIRPEDDDKPLHLIR